MLAIPVTPIKTRAAASTRAGGGTFGASSPASAFEIETDHASRSGIVTARIKGPALCLRVAELLVAPSPPRGEAEGHRVLEGGSLSPEAGCRARAGSRRLGLSMSTLEQAKSTLNVTSGKIDFETAGSGTARHEGHGGRAGVVTQVPLEARHGLMRVWLEDPQQRPPRTLGLTWARDNHYNHSHKGRVRSRRYDRTRRGRERGYATGTQGRLHKHYKRLRAPLAASL